MTKPIIQKAIKADLHEIADIFRECWNIDRLFSEEISHKYSYQYTLDCYSHCTFCFISKVNDEIVGFMMGRNGNEYSIDESIMKELKDIQNELNQYPPTARCMQTLQDYYTVGYNKMKEHKLDESHELVLFAVKNEYQGKGIGKELLFKSLEYLKECGLKECFLLTDSGCTYQMYDKYNFKRQLETPFKFKTPTVTLDIDLYVYTYDLTHL